MIHSHVFKITLSYHVLAYHLLNTKTIFLFPLVNYSEQYLNNLNKMHRLSCRTNLETRKQQKLEQELEELREKVKTAESKLTQQKTLTQNLQPAVANTEKVLLSDRMMLLKLENYCNRLGSQVKGSSYK